MMRVMLAVLVAGMLAVSRAEAASDPLVADLSKHLVAITTGFAGTDVLLFGAIDGDGEVVVVVRGPGQKDVVRRKDRHGGLWVNTGSARVDGVPSFYWLASTKPLAELAPAAVLDEFQLGLDHMVMNIRVADDDADSAHYRAALLRLKQAQGLYRDAGRAITFLGHQLFRAEIHLPANVPVGTYQVEVYLLAGGDVVSAQTTPLVISKIGIGADVFDFAHRHKLVYGAAAVFLAAVAGWLAAVALRK